MKNRFGFTLIEIMITLFLTCTILSTFTYCGANKVPKQNWIKFKKELQFEVDRVRNISQPGQIIIEGCEEKKNRAIMVQKKIQSIIYLPDDWVVAYGAVSVHSGWVQPGTIVLQNIKNKEFKKLSFSMGWGDFNLKST